MELEPLITGQEIAEYLQCSYTYFRDKISKGPRFPQPLRKGIWKKRDIVNFMQKITHI